MTNGGCYVEREAQIGSRAHVPKILDLSIGCRLTFTMNTDIIATRFPLVPERPANPSQNHYAIEIHLPHKTIAYVLCLSIDEMYVTEINNL